MLALIEYQNQYNSETEYSIASDFFLSPKDKRHAMQETNIISICIAIFHKRLNHFLFFLVAFLPNLIFLLNFILTMHAAHASFSLVCGVHVCIDRISSSFFA